MSLVSVSKKMTKGVFGETIEIISIMMRCDIKVKYDTNLQSHSEGMHFPFQEAKLQTLEEEHSDLQNNKTETDQELQQIKVSAIISVCFK